MFRSRFLSVVATCGLAASISFTSVAWAQSLGGVTPDPEIGPKNYRIDVKYAHRFEADLDDTGKFSEDNVFVRFGSRTKLSSSINWLNIAMYGFSGYHFENTGRGGWWGDVHSLTYVPALSWQINKSWSVLGGPALNVSAESGGDFGDGITGGGLAGFSWSPHSSLTLGAGVLVMSRLEDDASLTPLPIVRWRFADDWMLRTGLEAFGARQGFGLDVSWEASREVALRLGASFQRLRFRMDDDGPSCRPNDSNCPPGSNIKDGVGEDRTIPIFAEVAFGLAEGLHLEASAGVALGGNVRLEDKKGHKIDDQDYDPQGVIGLRLVSVF